MMQMDWSPWSVLELPSPPSARSLAEILDGGQSFRWNRAGSGAWEGTWAGHVVRLQLSSAGQLLWSAPAPLASSALEPLRRYLSPEGQEELRDCLPWRSDPHLATCMKAFPGLRILHQPLGEALLGFLCSSTKQIVQIKQICAELARRFGQEVVPGHRALPDWQQLAEVSEVELRACKLGFRARYVRETALFLRERPGWLEHLANLPYRPAKAALLELPGVGEKVADCVLLFGAHRLEAFPVDVWILRAMRQRYGLEGWRPAQIAHFGRVHFGAAAGLAQQYLFAYERMLRPPSSS